MPRAGRRCPDRWCDELAPCPTHGRPWASSARRTSLPGDWDARRARVLEDEPTCQLDYPGSWPTAAGMTSCQVTSTEVDHVDDPDDHNRSNLRGVCSSCHRRRTQEQSAAARRAARS